MPSTGATLPFTGPHRAISRHFLSAGVDIANWPVVRVVRCSATLSLPVLYLGTMAALTALILDSRLSELQRSDRFRSVRVKLVAA